MYADRLLAAGSKRSVKERLNEDFDDRVSLGRQSNPKRQRQDDEKWKHDLYEDGELPRVSNPKLGAKDLRLKLQRRVSTNASASGNVSQSRDLREKLSGIMHSQPLDNDVPKNRTLSDTKLVKRSSPAAAITEKKADNPPTVKNTKQKSESSVAALLKSLDLEKYLITFQAEEIDMAALVHMSDEDLKALGIPMGPRKKIHLALKSRRHN
ncbi:uncharacterized protein LOC116249778 [Nymphaea colorata]|nr:uncharacterized protein LOC116249778 [Nymphaea colorata]